jgi:hypothetical protein
MSWAKSIICIVLFALIWIVPSFRAIAATYFNICEEFLAKHKQKVLFTVLGLYIVITLFLQWGHPVDGDEGQAWLIAGDTHSLKEMYSLMGYEGSPALWHTLLRPFARPGLSFNIIYVINHIFVTIAIIIWLWRAPFPLVIRILLPFTYIFLTEYSVNARSYALSACLLFTAVTLYRDYHRKWALWASAFFLLANTNIHSTIICCGFAFFLLVNWFFSKNNPDIKGALLIGIGIVLVVLQVLPPPDLAGDLSGFGLRGSPGLIMTSVVTGTPTLSMIIYLALLVQVIATIQKKPVLFALLSTQLVLLFLLLFVYPGAVRHHFFLFLSIIMCLWISELTERYRPAMWLSLFVILGMMITTSITIIAKRTRSEHNHKKEITDYIKNEIRPDSTDFIACHPDNVAAAILPKLDYKKFYMPDINRWGSYTIWNQQRKSGLFDSKVVRNVANLMPDHKGYKRYYYLTIHQLPPDSASHYNIVLLKQASSEHLENAGNNWHTYYLYEIRKN